MLQYSYLIHKARGRHYKFATFDVLTAVLTELQASWRATSSQPVNSWIFVVASMVTP